jgi:hypothetical protein
MINSTVGGVRALVANMMLERAKELPAEEAVELWRAMQLVETGAPVEGLPRATLQLAMDFNRFPSARKLVEDKARACEQAALMPSTIG